MSPKRTHFHIQQSRIELSTERAWQLLSDVNTLARLCPPWLSIENTAGAKSIHEESIFDLKVHKGILRGNWKVRVSMLRKGFLIGFEILSPRKKVWVVWTKVLPGDNPHNCVLEDRIEFQPTSLFGIGKTPKRLERTIKEIIYYRHHTLKSDLSVLGLADPTKKQKILIAGGSGLVGSSFAKLARMRGHQIQLLSTQEITGRIHWDPEHGMIDADALEGFDTILNFAGFPIACRWNRKNKQRILDSRIKSSHLLVKTITRLNQPPKRYLQASATGYYGYDNQENVDERQPKGNGFLADVCEQWEAETQLLAGTDNIQAITARLGVVLTPKGGALAKMLPAFRSGIAGKLGSGRQYFPWISIDDLSRALIFLMEREDSGGFYNFCSPEPITNASFTRTLARTLSKPALLPAPSFALRLMFGKMAVEALLGGVDARPEALTEQGFQFAGGDLEESLKLLLGKS